jgi:hypothetical protein
VLLLLWLERVARLRTYTAWHGVPAGVLVGLVTYSYTGSRLLGTALRRRPRVFAGRGRWAFVLSGGRRSPSRSSDRPLCDPASGNLTARYDATTIARDGLSPPRVVLQAIGNWFVTETRGTGRRAAIPRRTSTTGGTARSSRRSCSSRSREPCSCC